MRTRRLTARNAAGFGALAWGGVVLRAGLAASGLGVGVWGGAGSALAQGPAAMDPSQVSGRSFQGLRLPLAAQDGAIELRAQRAHVWSEGSTNRLLLEGDVRCRLGLYEFNAARAAVWLEEIGGEPGDGAGTYQVFVYFDRVGSATDAASAAVVSADRLPVRGVLVPGEGVRLSCDLSTPGRPMAGRGDDGFLVEAEAALARSLRRLLPGYVEPRVRTPLDDLPRIRVPESRRAPTSLRDPGASRAFNPNPSLDGVAEASRLLEGSPIPEYSEPIFAKTGLVTLSAGERIAVSGEGSDAVLATGGVSVQYDDRESGRSLQISAQRAVVFLSGKPTPTEVARFDRNDVRGIYLEGDVWASDGTYTLRGPQVYYDLVANKAMVVDAVFWTYDQRRRLPLYVRAESIRQESTSEFKATKARLANSSFFEPEFTLGAGSVTISRRVESGEGEEAAGRAATRIDARDITLRASDVPFFYWPSFRGDPAQVPLRDVRFENSSENGFALKTRWNLAGLVGIEKPEWLSADLLGDYYAARGLGVGTRLGWSREQAQGDAMFYTLPNDTGRDVFRSGGRIERDGEFRSLVTAQNRWLLDDHWQVDASVASASDVAFTEVFFPEYAVERRQLETGIRVKRQEDNAVFTVDAVTNLDDFLTADYLLQSQGYLTRKLPEAAYKRLADDLLPEQRPGMLTHYSEYRAGYVAPAFDEALASERGLGDFNAQRVLGIASNQSPGERLAGEGLGEDAIFRGDTRQELVAVFHEGAVTISPFVVGRATFYDADFAGYRGGPGVDETRLWGGVGVRVSTRAQRVFDDLDSRVLDLHRLRHLVEPSVTAFAAGTNVERDALPVLDDEVENLLDGQMVRVGIAQTWQTQRGGPGRWHSADVLRLNTDLVFSSDDATRTSPVGRFFDPRPELSVAGDFADVDAVWQASDTLALTGAMVYDFELSQPAMTSGGLLLTHSEHFRSYLDSHFVNSQDSTIVSGGTFYELTEKYALGINASYDAERNGFQGASLFATRRFESLLFGGSIAYDDITGDVSFGFFLQPFGARGGAAIGGLGGQNVGTRFGS